MLALLVFYLWLPRNIEFIKRTILNAFKFRVMVSEYRSF